MGGFIKNEKKARSRGRERRREGGEEKERLGEEELGKERGYTDLLC